MVLILNILAFLVSTALVLGSPFYGPEAPCDKWHSNGTLLFAHCPERIDSLITALDLNSCYINSGGNIAPLDHGGFAASCNLTAIENGDRYLLADCWTGDATKPTTHNNISMSNIVNNNGHLSCGSVSGCIVGWEGCSPCSDTWIKGDPTTANCQP